jgi:hypothetical protein
MIILSEEELDKLHEKEKVLERLYEALRKHKIKCLETKRYRTLNEKLYKFLPEYNNLIEGELP